MKKVIQERKELNLWKAVFEKNWSGYSDFNRSIVGYFISHTVAVPLLLTMSKFHRLFYYLYC